jgi:hypothetical protein
MGDQELSKKLLCSVVLFHLDLKDLRCISSGRNQQGLEIRIISITSQAAIHTGTVVVVFEGQHTQLSIGSANHKSQCKH